MRCPLYALVWEPHPKFGKIQGWRGTEGLMADPYVKIPDWNLGSVFGRKEAQHGQN